jgi:hypothetical protein
MTLSRAVLGLMAVMVCNTAVQEAAYAQERRGSEQQREACTPDVFRLCMSEIPDSDRIVACLRQNVRQLSQPCRAVFSPGENAQRDNPRRYDDQPRRYEDQPQRYDDQPRRYEPPRGDDEW